MKTGTLIKKRQDFTLDGGVSSGISIDSDSRAGGVFISAFNSSIRVWL